MKAKLRQIECDEDTLLEIPENWISICLERNEYTTPRREAYTLYVL